MLRWSALALVPFALTVVGCPLWGPPPRVIDPARAAAEPGGLRGDGFDRRALEALERRGARFPAAGVGPADDAAVVAEALRVAPPSWSGRRADVESNDARIMLLRRRPRAAYVALGELMRSAADPGVRAGAANDFVSLDNRNQGGQAATPAYAGPEREAAVAEVERLLLSDPHPWPRQAASYAWLWELASPTRPTTEALRAALARETDETVRDDLERVLRAREPATASAH